MRCEKDEGTKGLRDLETVNGESLRKSAGFPSAKICENFLNFHVIYRLGNVVKVKREPRKPHTARRVPHAVFQI